MKWKGRRQAMDDIEVRDKPEPPQEGDVIFETGQIYHSPQAKFSPDDIKVAGELGRLNRDGKTPVPTPNPRSRTHDNIVTPGKWKTTTK